MQMGLKKKDILEAKLDIKKKKKISKINVILVVSND